MSIHTVKINRMILKSDKNVVRRNASTLEKVCYNDNVSKRTRMWQQRKQPVVKSSLTAPRANIQIFTN